PSTEQRDVVPAEDAVVRNGIFNVPVGHPILIAGKIIGADGSGGVIKNAGGERLISIKSHLRPQGSVDGEAFNGGNVDIGIPYEVIIPVVVSEVVFDIGQRVLYFLSYIGGDPIIQTGAGPGGSGY